MAPGCKPGGLTPYAGSNPAPCTRQAGKDEGGRMKYEHNGPISSFILHPFLAGVAQLVEHQPSKLRVASSNLVARSNCSRRQDSGPRSSGVERLLGKEEVMSSNLIAGSTMVARVT